MLSLLIVLTLFLYFCPLVYNTGQYPIWRSKIEYISDIHDVHNIIIGDSRAVAGFMPDVLKDNYYNLAVSGGSPIEGYYILKKYLEKQHVDKLILSFSPVHLELPEGFYELTLRYGLLSTSEINEVLGVSNALNDNLRVTKEDYAAGNYLTYKSRADFIELYLDSMLINYKWFSCYIPEIQKCLFELRYSKNKKIYSEIKSRKGNYDFGDASEGKGKNLEASKSAAFKNSKICDYYLIKLLELAKLNNIKTYYISAPFNADSYKDINAKNSQYFTQYNSYMESLKLKYSSVVWDANINCYENRYFGDPSHLNANGQNKFSNYAKEVISER
jgi:hypothetical protein